MLILSRVVGEEVLIGDRLVVMVMDVRNWGCKVRVRRVGPPRILGTDEDGQSIWDLGDIMTIRLGVDQEPTLLAPAIYLRCCETDRGKVRLGIDAPPTVLILRAELAHTVATGPHGGSTP